MFNDGIVFLIKENSSIFLKTIDPVFYEMVKMVEKFLDVNIDIGVSSLHREFGQLHDAWQEAGKALGYSRFLNTGRIVYIDQLEKSKPKIISLSESEISRIAYSVRYETDDELKKVMNTLKENVQSDKSVTNYRLYTINLVNIIVTFADSVGADLNEIVGDGILEKMSRFRNLDQIFDWVLSTLLNLRALNLKTKMTNSRRILENAVKLIDTEYSDPDVSIEGVCDDLGISVSYLSLLFRRENNTTFVKYLTRVRIEKAIELLTLTGERIIDIADQCGYREVYYFSHSFKKYSGVSPKKYREEHTNS